MFSTFLVMITKKSFFFCNFKMNSSLSTSRMDNLREIRPRTHMILNFVHKQVIKYFVNIIHNAAGGCVAPSQRPTPVLYTESGIFFLRRPDSASDY